MIRPKLLTIGGNTDIYIGEAEYLTPGTYYFQVPLSMTRIHACCIGAGAQGAVDGDGVGSDEWSGGGGGGLGWKNNIEVEPGEWLAVQVGAVVGPTEAPDEDGPSWIKRTAEPEEGQIHGEATGDPLVAGLSPADNFNNYAGGGGFIGDGGGNGGNGSFYITVGGYVGPKGSGGGAGGYTGGGSSGTTLGPGSPGQGGGGSGGCSRVYQGQGTTNGNRGGGTGIYGEGASGPASRTDSSEWVDVGGGYEAHPGKVGNPGSGGEGNQFGAGGAGNKDGWNGNANERAGHGAVRIIWGNQFRYPDNADITAT